jgi:hypothetical protein
LNFRCGLHTDLKGAFDLSEGKEFIVNAEMGQGILVTEEGRILV